MDALPFLAKPPAQPKPLYVVAGDEDFLKRQCIHVLREKVLGQEDAGLSVFAGDKAQYAEVFDELESVGFFAPRRLVIVENADPFVTQFRPLLEKKVPVHQGPGVLVLEVKTWPANTRLAKLVDAGSTLTCKAPGSARLPGWCVDWAKTRHQKNLSSGAAQLLVEYVGTEMGLLDQELLKLAIYVGDRSQIQEADVDKLVGQSREETVWKIFDALAVGNTREALTILDRLLDQGENVQKLLGGFGSQLRKLAQAARYIDQGDSLGAALDKAGFNAWSARNAEQQLRHLGRRRAGKLFDWLMEIHMNLRGNSPLPPRIQLERFVLQLAQKNS